MSKSNTSLASTFAKGLTSISFFSFISSITLCVASASFAATGTKAGKGVVPKPSIGTTTGVSVDTDSESLPARFARLFPKGGLLDVNGSLRRVYGTTFSTGTSASNSAQKFMREWSMLWKVPYAQLEMVGPFEDGAHTMPLVTCEDGESTEFTAAYFRQNVNGIPVFRSYAWGLVRNNDNFPMVLAGGTLRNIGNLPATLAGKDLTSGSIHIGLASSQALNQFRSPPEMTSPRYVIWAGIDADVQPAQLAVEFTATGGGVFDADNHQSMLFVVDPTNGNILHEENLILHAGTVTGQVNANVTSDYKADICSSEVVRGMPYLQIVSPQSANENPVYTDSTGAFTYNFNATGSSVVVSPKLTGKYFSVTSGSGGLVSVASQTIPNGGAGTFLFNPVPTETKTAQTNAYEIANRTRDMILSVSPSYAFISTQQYFSINVNLTNGNCNAYFAGNSINFFGAGGGCNNTAFGDVIAHEYGHCMVSAGGSWQGAYGEGQSDCVALLMTDRSSLGIGFQNCSVGVRDANNNCQYSPTNGSSCGSEIHAAGQLLSGCVWNLRNNFKTTYASDYRMRLASLVVNSTLLHAGQSDISNDITIDYLTLNDNNANLYDGTPDFAAISNAFGAHGMGVNVLSISLPQGAPSIISPTGDTSMNVLISQVTGTLESDSAKLFYKTSGDSTYQWAPLTEVGANQFVATFSSAPCNSIVDFYVQATSTNGMTVTLPQGSPVAPYSTLSARSVATILADTFDNSTTAFTVESTATAGRWVRDTVYKGASCVGAPTAVDSGSKAFITGALSCEDVDGGTTSLISPVVSGLGVDKLNLNFAMYFYQTPGGVADFAINDPLEVFVSNDNGASWVLAQSYEASQSQSWSARTINLFDYVEASSEMKVKFVAQDLGTDDLVEAGIDSVEFVNVGCPLFGDLDGNGYVDSADLSMILLNYGPCPGCPEDLDGSGDVDAADIGLLMLFWE